MKKLGNTYGEVLSSANLNVAELATLYKYITDSFEITTSAQLEELLASHTDSGEYMAGCFYLVEDEDDLEEMLVETGIGDLRESPRHGDVLPDTCLYLNNEETMVLIVSCTADWGGDAYILSKDLLASTPSVHEHVFEVNENA